MLPLSITLPKINMNNFLSYQFVAKFYGNYEGKILKRSKVYIWYDGQKNKREVYQFVGLENNEEGQSL